jgi:hypothetical protein
MTGPSALSPKILDGLDRIAAAAKGPFGPPSLRSLARSHLPLFDELQRQGASWRQIGLLIGLTGDDGQPITDGVLRATVSAARRAAGTPALDGAVRAEGCDRGETQGIKTQLSETQRSKTQLDATRNNRTQSSEALRQEARRNETISDEVQQPKQRPRQHDATARGRRQRPIAAGQATNARTQDIALPPQPSSGQSRRPPPGLDDNLLRRAARVQRFKEDY